MAATEGPYVQVACFCDQVIEDKSGTFSLIRVIDVITHSLAGPNPPAKLPTFQANLKLVLMFKSGRAQGRSLLKVVPELPTGETQDPLLFTIHFEGEEKGANVVLNFVFSFAFEGLYWFKVYVDDQMMTCVPLRIRYNPVVTPAQPGGPASPPR